MANWRVIENTGQTLVALLERRLAALGIANVSVGLVTTSSFTTLATVAEPYISLFLYQVACNPEMRNLPQPPGPDGLPVRQSLPLELCYLATVWGVRGVDDVASDNLATAEEARLLGLVMQALYDNAEIGRSDLVELPLVPVWAPHDALQVIAESLPVDSHYRIWDAAELGYRLSLVYRVRVASLEPGLQVAAPVVADAVVGVG